MSYDTRLLSPCLSAVQPAHSRFPQAFFDHCQAEKACLGFASPHPVHIFVMGGSADVGGFRAAAHLLHVALSFVPLDHCFWLNPSRPAEWPHTAHSLVVAGVGAGGAQRLHFRTPADLFLPHCSREKELCARNCLQTVHSFLASRTGGRAQRLHVRGSPDFLLH